MSELEAMIKTLGYIGYAVIPRAELAAAQALNAELARLTSAQTREIERLRAALAHYASIGNWWQPNWPDVMDENQRVEWWPESNDLPKDEPWSIAHVALSGGG